MSKANQKATQANELKTLRERVEELESQNRTLANLANAARRAVSQAYEAVVGEYAVAGAILGQRRQKTAQSPSAASQEASEGHEEPEGPAEEPAAPPAA